MLAELLSMMLVDLHCPMKLMHFVLIFRKDRLPGSPALDEARQEQVQYPQVSPCRPLQQQGRHLPGAHYGQFFDLAPALTPWCPRHRSCTPLLLVTLSWLLHTPMSYPSTGSLLA